MAFHIRTAAFSQKSAMKIKVMSTEKVLCPYKYTELSNP